MRKQQRGPDTCAAARHPDWNAGRRRLEHSCSGHVKRQRLAALAPTEKPLHFLGQVLSLVCAHVSVQAA